MSAEVHDRETMFAAELARQRALAHDRERRGLDTDDPDEVAAARVRLAELDELAARHGVGLRDR